MGTLRPHMIVVVDYGAGNSASIRNMLRKAGVESRVSSSPDDILAASRIVLPGVGHFDHGMRGLRERGLVEVLTQRVRVDGVPVLGICLGLQLFARGSEEGDEPGLGWIDADVRKFDLSRLAASLRVPHMGWADVTPAKPSALFEGMHSAPRFYFVHSYHLVCDRREDVLVTATHGYEFDAGVESGNVHGVQFHPEKSHKYGLRLLERFAKGLA